MYSNKNKLFDHWDRFVKYGYEIEKDCDIKILEGYTCGINAVRFKYLKGYKEKELTIIIDSEYIPTEINFKSFFKKATKPESIKKITR
ncbi:MAG: hypothetical protein ABF311_10805 [Polaribacter sp.]